MSVTVTFSHDDPTALLKDMATMAGVPVTPVYAASADTGREVSDATQGAGGKDVETVATGKPPRVSRKPKPVTLEATATSVTTEPPAAQAISTGGERVDPDAKAQDAADEASPEQPAETVKVFTLDDVRNAATPYISKYTMAAAQADLQDVLQAAVGIRQISKLNPTDQDQLKKAIAAFDACANVPGKVAQKLAADKAAADAKAVEAAGGAVA